MKDYKLIERIKNLQLAIELEIKLVIKENDTLSTEELNNLMFALADANTANYDLQKHLMDKFG